MDYSKQAERVLEFGTLVISIPIVTDWSQNGYREKMVTIFRRDCPLKLAESLAAEFFEMNRSRERFEADSCEVRWLPRPVWLHM